MVLSRIASGTGWPGVEIWAVCTCILGQFELGIGSVVKHSTVNPGIASSMPPTPTKITKRKNAPVYQ